MFFGGMPGMDGGFGRRGGGGKPADTTKFYKVLEVSKDATGPEIKKAYRKLAIKHHPDKGGDPETFKEITKAYEVLSDDDKRRTYDQFGEQGLEAGGGGGGDPTDIFDLFTGGGGRKQKQGKRKGKDLSHPMDVTLEQIYSGYTKKLAINRTVIDKKTGVKECTACDGNGMVTQVVRMGNMIQQMRQQCGQCNGEGNSFKTIKEKEILEVYVEKGAPDGHKVTFYNKADELPNHEPGDVHFVLQEKAHPDFKRVKADLFVQRKISLLEALTGFSMEITHLDGRKLLVQTKPGEVIAPPPMVGSADWVCLNDTDCPGEDVAKCQHGDVSKLKEVCVQKGFDGFVLDTSGPQPTAYFRQLTRDEFLKKKKTKKNMKLYVIPDPAEAAAERMRKAVKGEGMPQFKNPMLKGNLFIELEIDFPKSVSEDCARQLKAILPGPESSSQVIETDDHEIHYVQDMDPKASEAEASHAYEEDDDEEGHGHPMGGQGVQCAQQ